MPNRRLIQSQLGPIQPQIKTTGFMAYMMLTVSLIEGERDNILDEWFPNTFYPGPPNNC
jgi:hypothetical protein